MTPRMRAGVIGLGVGMRHAEAYQKHPGSDLAAVCDFSRNQLETAEKVFPGVRTTQNPEEILEDPDIDLISIASFDQYHFPQAARAIALEKHVFAEKPFCLFHEEARRLRELLQAHPRVLFSSNLALRTIPAFLRLKQEIKSGRLGHLYWMQADYLWGRTEKLTQGWRAREPFYSIIHGAGVHMIDLAMWLTGRRPVLVDGFGSRIATGRAAPEPHDFAGVTLRFGDGLAAQITAHGACVHPHFHRLAVFGSEKTFINDLAGCYLLDSTASDAPRQPVAEDYPGRNHRGDLILGFVDAAIGLRPAPPVTVDDAFAAMSVCLAGQKSLEDHQTVTVEYF